MSRQYYGIEDLALTPTQRDTMLDALRQLGANTSPRPHLRNHWRARLDNKAVIFEGQFNDEDWTIENIKTRLATLLGVNLAVIDAWIDHTQYGPVVTFSAGGTERMRMIAFGGFLAPWEASHDAVLSYLATHLAEWVGVA